MCRGKVCIEIIISELLPHKIDWKLKKIYVTNYYLLMVDQTIWSGFLEFTLKNLLVILMFVQVWVRTPSLEFNHPSFST